jgi:hypothetical protein
MPILSIRFTLVVVCFALWALVLGPVRADVPPPETVRLTNQHVDLRVVYLPGTTNPLSLRVRDSDAGILYRAEEVVLVVAESARVAIPDGFDIFGSPGASLWVLPQSQDPALLYLGFSGQGLPAGAFASPLRIGLRSVSGPGNFFVWQADPFSGIAVGMNSRDGITDADMVSPSVNGHDHFNFGFTSNGLYRVVFRPTASPLGATTNLTGEDVAVTFEVEPLPAPPMSAWSHWVLANFPGMEISGVEPGADPDGDRSSNLEEFLTATDPNDPADVIRLAIRRAGGSAVRLSLPFVPERAPSVSVGLESASDPRGPWSSASVPLSAGTGELWAVVELPAGTVSSFHRLRLQLLDLPASMP